MKKNGIFFLALFFLSFTIEAQIEKVEIGIDGFTCSLCGMGVDKSIKTLPWVEEVKMDLNSGVAEVFFREGSVVSIFELSKKVLNGGFSIRYIKTTVRFNNVELSDSYRIKIEEEVYHFIDTKEGTYNGVYQLLHLNKKMISSKRYTQRARWIKEAERKFGKQRNVYFVTLL